MNILPSFMTASRTAALAGFLSLPASAGLINNGGFESGFTGWTRLDSLGSDGSFQLQSGTTSPVNGLTVSAPPGGSQAAMTDSGAGGSHVLYQDFTVPAGVTSATVDFSLYINNRAGAFYVPDSPASLDWTTPTLNQQARVDLVTIGADAFSVASGDVYQNLYQTLVSDPTESGYTSYSIDVTSLFQAHAGETLRLRFAEADNVFIFNLGVDDVEVRYSIDVAVPEASTWVAMPAVVGMLAFSYRRLRRRNSQDDR